jgi:phosphatidylserine/phosphatidylglycerophosphate/cardiolipin synthase-like enzyme
MTMFDSATPRRPGIDFWRPVFGIITSALAGLRRAAKPVVILTLMGLPAALAHGASVAPDFELVHNAPVETSLATPDLRDAATVWCEMIDGARESIDLEQFYVSGKPGESLDRVIASLDAAGKRGVRIRFLMEKQGLSASDTATIDRLKRIPNLDFRMLAWSAVNGSGIIHAKFFVVDNHVAYVGSQNFDWRSLEHIDETGLRIADVTIVDQLHRIFEQDWHAQALVAVGERVPSLRSEDFAPIDGKAFLVASPNAFNPPDVADSQAALIKLIASAQHDIRIEVMDYAAVAFGGGAYTVIDNALRAAAARGVHIKLIVADWDLTRQKLPSLESLAAVPNVEIRVARIPPASTGIIPYARVVHTKIMEIDDAIAWVGTSNWEGGYLDTSRNVEIVLRDQAMASRIDALEAQLWTSSYVRPLAEAEHDPQPRPGGQ